MSVEEDINGIGWWIGWHPWMTVLGITFLGILVGVVVDEVGPVAAVALLLGIAVYFWGTRVINANYEDLLSQYISKIERGAARGIDVAEANTYSLTWGETESPILVEPKRFYTTTALVVTGTSVNINRGAEYQMQSREQKSGRSNQELFYDQITAVESHQDGNQSTLEIRTSDGQSIEVSSSATKPVNAAISDIRKNLRSVKAGRDSSMGKPSQQQQSTAPETQQTTQETAGRQSTDTPEDTSTDSGSSSTPDTEPKRMCLSCEEQINHDAEFCPSCGVDSPFEETPDEPVSDDDKQRQDPPHSAVIDVANDVRRQRSPESSTAKQLCSVLSNQSASEAELRSALETAVEELETAATVSKTVESASRRPSAKEYEQLRHDLKQQRGQLPAAIEPLASELAELNEKLDQQETDHSDIIVEVDAICDQAERSNAISFQSRETSERAAELAAALQDARAVITEPTVSLDKIVDGVERQIRPSSRQAQELIDGLRTLQDDSKLETTIRSVVETLDDHAETEQMLSEIQVEDVRRRLESLNRELTSEDSPVHSHLADRIRELEAQIDGAETVDDIQLFAIYQEISFYDRTLLPRLSRSMGGGSSANGDELLDTVQERVAEIQSEFVSVRPDHNHSIPKHFLELAEELSADAEQDLANNPDRATGVLIATDALLDHVEQLYERNEYSVMLRRLRG